MEKHLDFLLENSIPFKGYKESKLIFSLHKRENRHNEVYFYHHLDPTLLYEIGYVCERFGVLYHVTVNGQHLAGSSLTYLKAKKLLLKIAKQIILNEYYLGLDEIQILLS